MVLFYIDTSTIIKRYRNEEGTSFVDILWNEVCETNEHKLCTSTLSKKEFTDVMRSLQEDGELSDEEHKRLLSAYKKDVKTMSVHSIGKSIKENGKKMEKSHGLSSSDALHLACALELKKEIGEDLYLVSSNDDLIIAADEEGLGTLAPQDRPIRELKAILKGEDEEVHFYIPC